MNLIQISQKNLTNRRRFSRTQQPKSNFVSGKPISTFTLLYITQLIQHDSFREIEYLYSHNSCWGDKDLLLPSTLILGGDCGMLPHRADQNICALAVVCLVLLHFYLHSVVCQPWSVFTVQWQESQFLGRALCRDRGRTMKISISTL